MTDYCDVCIFKKNSCVCQDFWKDFDKTFSCDLSLWPSVEPSKLSISTITINFKLENALIDLSKLEEQFEKTLFTRSINYKKNSKKSKKDAVVNFNFYNQCSITSYIPKETSSKELIKVVTKIFHNGSFTMTGVRNIQTIVHMMRSMISLLIGYKDVLLLSGKLKIKDTKISLINTDFTVKYKIKQKNLNDIMKSYIETGNIRSSTFDTDEYPGVKIKYLHYGKNPDIKRTFTRKSVEKYEGEVTIAVFKTGKIIITGGKNATETIGAYKFINQVFEDYDQTIFKKNELVSNVTKRKIYLRKVIISELEKEKYQDSIEPHKEKMKSIFVFIKSLRKLKSLKST